MSMYTELPLRTPCPDCGNPLTLWCNDDGGTIECSKCGYTERANKENVACPNCGSTSARWFNKGEGTIECSNFGYTVNAGKESDPVNSPSHYVGKIECIDYLMDKLTKEEFTGFCMGNVLKYSSRWRKKDGVQDLKKAKVYLEWAIENEEKTEVNGDA